MNRRISCRECRSQLIGYVNQQVPHRMRQRIGAHLSECPMCYTEYVAQRHLSDELAFALPLLGQPKQPQLGRVWSAIQSEMNRPTPVARAPLTRYAVACLILALALVLPWSLDKQQVALAVPQQPAAPLVPGATEAASTEEPRAVATVAPNVTNAAIPAAETPNTPSK